MMLERLKSLPLTIGLTLLIWLYAESQVRTEAPDEETAQVGNVPVWWAGPPDTSNINDLFIEPRLVTVDVVGPKQAVDALLEKRDVAAYLFLSGSDLKATEALPGQKALSIQVGPDVRVPNPPVVKFYFRERNPARTR